MLGLFWAWMVSRPFAWAALLHSESFEIRALAVTSMRRVPELEANDLGHLLAVYGIKAIGYFPVDLGSLDAGGRLASLPFGSLAATNFIKI